MKGARANPRLALVGCGQVSHSFHLPALRSLGWRPDAVVDRDLTAADATARLSGGIAIQDIAALPDAIEAVLVATPASTHAALCAPLLERGMAVLVEKPLACTDDEARLLLHAAQHGGGRLWVGNQRRHLAGWRWAKTAIASGALGDIRHFAFEDGAVHANRAAPLDFWRPAHPTQGGVLLDLGPHTIDLMRWWLGEAAEIACQDDSEGGPEAEVRIDVTLSSGARGHIDLSLLRRLKRKATITGSRATIEVDLYSGAVQVIGTVDGAAAPPAPQRAIEAFTDQLRLWRAALQGDGEAGERLVDGADGAGTVAFIERCRKSRRPVSPGWRPVRLPASVAVPDASVLVTGAAGFIGSRLVESLAERGHRNIHAVVRDFGSCASIARWPVTLHRADFGVPEQIGPLLENMGTVVHAAFDPRADADKSVEAAARLFRSARLSGVRRLVHLSSTAVYQPFSDGRLDETSVPPPPPHGYALTKWRIEQAVGAEIDAGLDAIILQPGVVQGPFGRLWTHRPIEDFERGGLAMPVEKEGWCNLVHVDDVVQAMILAAQAPATLAGERFIVTGPDTIGWHAYFARLARCVDGAAIVPMRTADILALAQRRKRFAALIAPLKHSRMLWLKERLLRLMGSSGVARAKAMAELRREPRGLAIHDPAALATYQIRVRLDCAKAMSLLGYRPLYDCRTGLQASIDYLRWAYPALLVSEAGDRGEDAPATG